jgi:hypothetical protein
VTNGTLRFDPGVRRENLITEPRGIGRSCSRGHRTYLVVLYIITYFIETECRGDRLSTESRQPCIQVCHHSKMDDARGRLYAFPKPIMSRFDRRFSCTCPPEGRGEVERDDKGVGRAGTFCVIL